MFESISKLFTHWPNGFLDVLGYHFFWGWARMKPKAVLSLSLPCTSWVMLKYLKYAEIFEIFGKICQKYAERWNIFAQFTLPMTNESKSLISAYWHLYMSVELGLEAYLAHFTKYFKYFSIFQIFQHNPWSAWQWQAQNSFWFHSSSNPKKVVT